MKYIIALDQGTTSTRAVLFDKSGAIVSSYGREIEQFYPAPGLVEHDAEELFFSSLRAVQRAMELAGASAYDIAALGITNLIFLRFKTCYKNVANFVFSLFIS